jgi:hypothetical protein
MYLFIFLALPLIIYLSLATLPKGMPAALGLAVAGLLLVLGYFAAPTAGSLLTLASIGVGMGVIAQSVRWAAGDHLTQRLYFTLLGLLPLLVLVVLSFSFGA